MTLTIFETFELANENLSKMEATPGNLLACITFHKYELSRHGIVC
jgi:hypothetical protein